MDTVRPIRPAATVIVTAPDIAAPGMATPDMAAHDGEIPYSVFAVKRSHGSGFMAGAHVFPGGVVDEADQNPWWSHEPNQESNDEDLPFRLAAIRELFEETGILLVNPPEAAKDLTKEDINEHREAVHDDASKFRDLCESLNCIPAVEKMLPWSRWVTPRQERRRFDTRFYVAILSHQPFARHDDHETISSCWMSPQEALDAADAGDIFLPPPTWYTFRELNQSPSQDALEACIRAGRSLTPIEPQIKHHADHFILLLPGDADHDEYGGAPDTLNRIVLKDGKYSFERSGSNTGES